MKILQDLRDQGRGQDLTSLLKLIPYAQFLGLQVEQQGNEVITVLPFQDHLVGNTNLPAVHGSAIGAMLEMTTYGRAIVTRRGRLVANVRTELWQEEPDKPVAVAHGHFLLSPLD